MARPSPFPSKPNLQFLRPPQPPAAKAIASLSSLVIPSDPIRSSLGIYPRPRRRDDWYPTRTRCSAAYKSGIGRETGGVDDGSVNQFQAERHTMRSISIHDDPDREERRRKLQEVYAATFDIELELDRRYEEFLKLQPASSKAIAMMHVPKVGDTREARCHVCLDDFEEGDMLRTMPCAHSFHQRCIFPVLRNQRACPVCDFKLPTDEEQDELDARASARSIL